MSTATTNRIWFTTNQAAELSGHHPQTVRAALISGELKGSQRRAGSHWRIHRDALTAWIEGE